MRVIHEFICMVKKLIVEYGVILVSMELGGNKK